MNRILDNIPLGVLQKYVPLVVESPGEVLAIAAQQHLLASKDNNIVVQVAISRDVVGRIDEVNSLQYKSGDSDKEMEQKLRQIEARHTESNNLTMADFNLLISHVEQQQQVRSPPDIVDMQTKVYSCLSENRQFPLDCHQIIAEFTQFMANSDMDLLKQQVARILVNDFSKQREELLDTKNNEAEHYYIF